MTARFRHDAASVLLAVPAPRSGLVRRLVFRSHGDPARRRMLAWLASVDDMQLVKFGLTPADIAMLRETARGQRA